MNQLMVSNSLESRKDALEKELNELLEVKHMVESEIFQKYFASPLHREDKALKDAYECNSLAEIKLLQGKHWGIRRFFECVDELETRIKFIRNDLDKI